MKIKHLLWTLAFLVPWRGTCLAAGDGPVQWHYTAVQQGPGQYQLSFQASITEGWKLFSVTMQDDLPNSRVQLDSLPGLKLLSIEEKGQLRQAPEPLFDKAEIRYFEGKVEILVSFSLQPVQRDITGSIRYWAIKKDSVVGPVSIPFRFAWDKTGML